MLANRKTVPNVGRLTTGRRSGTRRTGGSRASSRDRLLAPRRLGSGRRGCADAARRGNSCVRPSGRAPMSQRAAREMHPVGGGDQLHRRDDSATGVRRQSRVHVPSEARLARHVHEEAAVHAHVPHPARGALERRRAGHGPGLRLHAPGAGGKKCGASGVRKTGPAPRPPCQRRRREDGQSRPPLPLLGVAISLRERRSRACASRRRPDEDLERQHQQPEDGQADRERSFPARELGARSPAHARAQSALLGGAPSVSRPGRHPLPGREREPGRLVPERRGGRGVHDLPR